MHEERHHRDAMHEERHHRDARPPKESLQLPNSVNGRINTIQLHHQSQHVTLFRLTDPCRAAPAHSAPSRAAAFLKSLCRCM